MLHRPPLPPRFLFSLQESSPAHASGDPAAAASVHAQDQRDQWPTVSFARMRAGLRSALKTECSGFKFQNGGRSLRWFREHSTDNEERYALLWQGHVRLYEEHWVLVKPRRRLFMWLNLIRLDRAYRQRYSVQDIAERFRGVGRPHMQAMLSDGIVERAVRWALDPRSGGESFVPLVLGLGLGVAADLGRHILLALALQGGWTWLLEPWQAAVVSSRSEAEWQDMLAAGAIETGSLSLVQENCRHDRTRIRSSRGILRAIGRLGSIEMLAWLDVRKLGSAAHNPQLCHLLKGAAECDHVPLMDTLPRSLSVQAADRVMGPMLLRFACNSGALHAVEWLVSTGAVPDSRSLNAAVETGHYTLVRYLHTWHGFATDSAVSAGAVAIMLHESKPDCLAILEYLVQHCQYDPTCKNIVCTAIAANVRSDVLRFLATHASPDTWDGALADEKVIGDLDVQDLLHAAAWDAKRPA